MKENNARKHMEVIKTEHSPTTEITQIEYDDLVSAGRFHRARTGNEWTSFRLVLWEARDRFRTSPTGGRPRTGTNDPVLSWEGYCDDIGVPKRTANRILKDFEQQLLARGIASNSISELGKDELAIVLSAPVSSTELLPAPEQTERIATLEEELQNERQLRVDLETDQRSNDLETQLNEALQEVENLKTQGAESLTDVGLEVDKLKKKRAKLHRQVDDAEVAHAIRMTQSHLPELEIITAAKPATLTRNRPAVLQILQPLEACVSRIREVIGAHE